DGGESAERQRDQDQRVPRQRRVDGEFHERVHRAVQRRRAGRRHLELDAGTARDPAGDLFLGDDPGRHEARRAAVLPAATLQFGPGGGGAKRRHDDRRQEPGRDDRRRFDRDRPGGGRRNGEDRQRGVGGRQRDHGVAAAARRSGRHDSRRRDERAG